MNMVEVVDELRAFNIIAQFNTLNCCECNAVITR